MEGTADGSDKGLEEGALLKLGQLEGDEDGWADKLGVADGKVLVGVADTARRMGASFQQTASSWPPLNL